MKFKINNKYVRWGLTAFLVLACAILFYYFVFHGNNIMAALKTITNILMPVVVGLAMAYLLSPVLNFIEQKILFPLCDKIGIKNSRRRSGVVRGISVFLTAFVFLAMIYMLFYMLISQLVPSIQNIVNNFDRYTGNVMNWINKILDDNPDVRNYAISTINQYSQQLDNLMTKLSSNAIVLLQTVTSTASNILGMLWDFIIGFIISIYVMISKEKFIAQSKKMIYSIFERNTANIIIRNFRFTHRTFIGFLGGKIADSIIIGILCFIGVTLMKTPYGALISVIIGVTNVIPFFGPYLGAIPSAFLVLIVDPLHPLNCVYFLIFILILQQFDGNFLGPKILGSSTGLTSFWVIFAITLFGGLFGIVGMIIGVPIFAVIYAAIKSLVNTALLKKQMPIESNKYENLEYVDDEGFHNFTVRGKNIVEKLAEKEKKELKKRVKRELGKHSTDSDPHREETAGQTGKDDLSDDDHKGSDLS